MSYELNNAELRALLQAIDLPIDAAGDQHRGISEALRCAHDKLVAANYAVMYRAVKLAQPDKIPTISASNHNPVRTVIVTVMIATDAEVKDVTRAVRTVLDEADAFSYHLSVAEIIP